MFWAYIDISCSSSTSSPTDQVISNQLPRKLLWSNDMKTCKLVTIDAMFWLIWFFMNISIQIPTHIDLPSYFQIKSLDKEFSNVWELQSIVIYLEYAEDVLFVSTIGESQCKINP